jgi:outer membrane receptor protein involved in Fe transport
LGSVALSGGANPDETWNLTGYLQDQSASQTFSSVSASRTSETPASNQFSVPAIALGAAASSSWAGSSGSVTTLGADLRDIRGETREDYLYANGAFTDQRFAGGRQTFAGLFAERTQPLVAGLHAYAGVRLDRWEDSDGHLRTSVISTGAPLSGSAYPTQTGDVFSPSAGLVWRAAPGLELHVAAQRAFRQPTLNELYRPFQQGSTVTLANPGLSTEHADTAEAGADWRRGRVRLSLVGFVARLEDPVTNVTIAVGPGTFPGFGKLPAGGVGQERLNLGRIDTQGVQLGASWRESAALSVDFSVLGENATIASAPGQAALVGNDVPEVPRWNAALSVTWRPLGRIRLSLRARRTGQDYDDTQNLLPLAAATEIDVSMELELARHVRAFATVDNLADSMIETAHSATGVFNIAPPRTSNAGVRLDW